MNVLVELIKKVNWKPVLVTLAGAIAESTTGAIVSQLQENKIKDMEKRISELEKEKENK